MKSGAIILAGILAGVTVAIGILAAFVFVGPDPVGLRPTPIPTVAPTPVPSPSAAPSMAVPSASALASIDPSDAGQSGFHVGNPAPALRVPQVGGGTIDLAALRGKPVWVNFMQTTCPECIDEFPRMNAFQARYGDEGLIVVAIDVREDEGTVASFAQRLGATFPLGLDLDGAAQRTWGTYALPIHFWIDRDGIVRAGALGGIGPDVMAEGIQKIMPGVTVTP
ncbi:MAG TPA: TlpA disulfide reductase family protein [Candidatus Limnocylindrales bacterium]|nr:TlpA disulfide reductase family protein [Candidatus Limnocylindrales bacterium]